MDHQEIIENIGKRIKAIRLEKNMTQLDLSAKCAMEQSNLARIETGKTSPTVKTLLIIAEALEIDIKELF